MKAIRIDGSTPGGKRERLADRVPLDTPLSVQVFPVYGCNLACDYCVHSLPMAERGFIAKQGTLDFALYKKAMDDLRIFPRKLKMLRFAGTGEPLLHPEIVEMITYAKTAGVAESIDIVTNGLLLTKDMILGLVEAGLGRIRISLQGLDDRAYSYRCEEGTFNRLVENIRFFYEKRKKTQIYVKIIDVSLPSAGEARFMELFGDIADFLAIEHLIPAVDKIDYDKLGGAELTQNGSNVLDVEVCPQPFYMLQLNPDGNVVPCCAMETPYVWGNVEADSLQTIWNGEARHMFLQYQLEKRKAEFAVCSKCQQYRYAMFAEDILDDDREEILARLK